MIAWHLIPIYPGNVGALFFPSASGPIRWTPDGPLYRVGTVGLEAEQNPPLKRGQLALTARIFVGLNVGKRRVWDLPDVVEAAKAHWGLARWREGERGGASFLSQHGFYDSPTGFISEESVQVVIFTAAKRSDVETFSRAMRKFGLALAEKLRQETVLVEIQIRGVTHSLEYVSARELPEAPTKKKRKRR